MSSVVGRKREPVCVYWLSTSDYFFALKTHQQKHLEIFLCVSIEMNLFFGLENKTESITLIMHFFFFFLHYWI